MFNLLVFPFFAWTVQFAFLAYLEKSIYMEINTLIRLNSGTSTCSAHLNSLLKMDLQFSGALHTVSSQETNKKLKSRKL